MLALLLTLQSAPPPPPPHHSLPAPAADPAAWITADDYPLEALRNNQEGTVRLAIAVDKDGKGIGCIVEVSSGASSLDEAGCTALMARASFRPARTVRGKAVAGILEAQHQLAHSSRRRCQDSAGQFARRRGRHRVRGDRQGCEQAPCRIFMRGAEGRAAAERQAAHRCNPRAASRPAGHLRTRPGSRAGKFHLPAEIAKGTPRARSSVG